MKERIKVISKLDQFKTVLTITSKNATQVTVSFTNDFGKRITNVRMKSDVDYLIEEGCYIPVG